MSSPPPYQIGIVYDPNEISIPEAYPQMLEVYISSISSMTGLDMSFASNCISLTGPASLDLRIPLPMRVEADSIKAAFKRKKQMLIVSGRVLTVDEGQPGELVENVMKARKAQMGVVEPGLSAAAEEEAEKDPENVPPPPPTPSAGALLDKYSKVKGGGVGETPLAPPSSSAPSTTAYDNQKVTVLAYPTNYLQLISPAALVEVTAACLTLAQGGKLADFPDASMKSVMESFPSRAQSELCRQLLMQAVKYAEQGTGGATLPDAAKQKFVQLAEFQQKKIEGVLQEQYKKEEQKRRPLSDLAGSK